MLVCSVFTNPAGVSAATTARTDDAGLRPRNWATEQRRFIEPSDRNRILIDARQRQYRNFPLGLFLIAGEQGHQLGRRVKQPVALRAIDLRRSGPELLCTDFDGDEGIGN